MIELTATDEHKFSAYRADPAGAPKGAVVVLQDERGLTAGIRKLADGFAEKGYVAIAPALFDVVKANVELGADEEARKEGRAISEQVGLEWPMGAIQASVDAVKDAGKVAVVGYSWGGYLAYLAANKVKGLSCAIAYSADAVTNESREKRRIPTLLHFGENDELMSEEEIVQFRAQHPDVSAFSYPAASHNFCCEESSAYDADAAQKALERTMFWISQYVEGQAPVLMKNAGAYAQAKTDKKAKKKADDDMGPPDA